MTTYVLLLRAINVGGNRKVPMARLSELMAEIGFEDVRTYVRSGNVVVSASGSAKSVATKASAAIEAEFGFAVPVIVRTAAQLQAVVDADPLGDVASEPKLYHVTFYDEAPARDVFDHVDAEAYEPSCFELLGAELYTWTPSGSHDDKLMRELGKATKASPGTARNWRTVGKLLELASTG